MFRNRECVGDVSFESEVWASPHDVHVQYIQSQQRAIANGTRTGTVHTSTVTAPPPIEYSTVRRTRDTRENVVDISLISNN
jgi:hypothetical protein